MSPVAAKPEAGALIPGSGGCRKVRWSTSGQGKRGGARVVNILNVELFHDPWALHRNMKICTNGTVWLLIVYKKAKFDILPTTFLARLRKAVQDAL